MMKILQCKKNRQSETDLLKTQIELNKLKWRNQQTPPPRLLGKIYNRKVRKLEKEEWIKTTICKQNIRYYANMYANIPGLMTLASRTQGINAPLPLRTPKNP